MKKRTTDVPKKAIVQRTKPQSDSESNDDNNSDEAVVSQISFENRMKYMKLGVPQEEFTDEVKEQEFERVRKIAQDKRKALGQKKKSNDAYDLWMENSLTFTRPAEMSSKIPVARFKANVPSAYKVNSARLYWRFHRSVVVSSAGDPEDL